MNQRRLVVPTYLLALLLLVAGCTIPGLGLLKSGPEPEPTPLGDTLSFSIPAYTFNLNPGESVPGTRLHYVGRSGDTYQVTIDGLEATKRIGDSFIWSGVMAPGVYTNYNLRLTTAVFGKLPVAGPVEIIVFNPVPVEMPLTADITGAGPYFGNILINYRVPPGRLVPGSSLIYDGVFMQGEGQQATQLAKMSGLSGYPYFALGDSLVWEGQVRENVYIRYNLRVTAISEDSLRLSGIAELWIGRLPKND